MSSSERQPFIPNAVSNNIHSEVRGNMRNNVFELHYYPKILMILIFFILLELVSSIVMLYYYWHQTCNKMIAIWIAAYSGRLVVYLPINLYRFSLGERSTMPYIDAFSGLVSLFSFCWWITGQVWFFGPNDCMVNSKPLYIYAMILLLGNYALAIFAILLVIAIIFCIPQTWLLAILSSFGEKRGASSKDLNSVPVVFYSSANYTGDKGNDSSCAICMVDYIDNDPLRVLPCNHRFHKACIDQWLNINKTCPYCRHDITVKFDSGESLILPCNDELDSSVDSLV